MFGGLGLTLHRNSAGQRVSKILDAATAAAEEHRRRISTATINMVVRDAVNWRQPPTLRGSSRKGRIYYATQVCSTPCLPQYMIAPCKADICAAALAAWLQLQGQQPLRHTGTHTPCQCPVARQICVFQAALPVMLDLMASTYDQ